MSSTPPGHAPSTPAKAAKGFSSSWLGRIAVTPFSVGNSTRLAGSNAAGSDIIVVHVVVCDGFTFCAVRGELLEERFDLVDGVEWFAVVGTRHVITSRGTATTESRVQLCSGVTPERTSPSGHHQILLARPRTWSRPGYSTGRCRASGPGLHASCVNT
jgi:hypothetical protein